MSGTSDSFTQNNAKETFRPADNFRGQPRPEHHLHRDSEPLPSKDSTSHDNGRLKGSGPWENRRDIGAFIYLPATAPSPASFDTRTTLIGDVRFLGVTGFHQGTPDFHDSPSGQNAFNSERPLNVKPTNEGGVAIDGRGDLPEGHSNVADKMIGKAQKVIYLPVPSASSVPTNTLCKVAGKYMNKPELHEKGELRESGGKLAVTGEARVPHD